MTAERVRTKLAVAAALRRQARADEARADQLEAEAMGLTLAEMEAEHADDLG